MKRMCKDGKVRDYKTLEERIWARMTPLERSIVDRVGQWTLRNGRHWDSALSRYVNRCEHCKHYFLAERYDKKTCSEACKKGRQRANAKANFERSNQTRF